MADGRCCPTSISRSSTLRPKCSAHAPPGRAGEDAGARSAAGARPVPISPSARPSSSGSRARRRMTSRCCSTGLRKPSSIVSAVFATSRSRARKPTTLRRPVARRLKEERWHRLMQRQQAISARRLKRKVGTRQKVIIDDVGPTVEGTHEGRCTADRRRGPCRKPPPVARRARSRPSGSSARTPMTCTEPPWGSDQRAPRMRARR